MPCSHSTRDPCSACARYDRAELLYRVMQAEELGHRPGAAEPWLSFALLGGSTQRGWFAVADAARAMAW